jgi:hypothetical protein
MGKVKQLAVDLKRYNELKLKLNPNNDMFIIMENTPEWNEFNLLSIKLMPYFKMISQLN